MAGERKTYRTLVKLGGEHIGPETIGRKLGINTIDAEMWLTKLAESGLVKHSDYDNSWSVAGVPDWVDEP
jgi:Mn-dependent DtxR family transcriptional regulator